MKIPNKIYYGKVENNKLKLYDDVKFNELKNSLNGKEIELSLGQFGRKRTSPQNRWLFGVAYKIIGDYIGERDLEKVNELCKAEFPIKEKLEIKTKTGVKFVGITTSTSKMNTIEFQEYKEWLQTWASETLGCYIPDPNEDYKLK